MKRRIQTWAYGLAGGCIGGGAASVFAWMGMTAAKAVGADVPTLNFEAVKVLFLIGVVTHGAAFLIKSPLPPLEDDDRDANNERQK